jgi:aminoglycoside phosphotransferase (APT) family kinase protein
VGGERRAARVEPLAVRAKSAVYRLAGTGVVAKRCRAETAAVERLVHERLLPGLPVASLRLLGGSEPDADGFCWLFLEDAGEESYSYSDERHRRLAGSWLGRLHGAAAALEPPPLPDRGPRHFRERLGLAREAAAARLDAAAAEDELRVLAATVEQCDELAARWDELASFCERLPRTLVHGDFTALNVRVRGGRLYAIDWEKSGWGAPIVDFVRGLDLPAYRRALAAEGVRVAPADVDRLAQYAKVVRPLMHAWPRKAVEKIDAYRAHMGEAMRELGWAEPQEAALR